MAEETLRIPSGHVVMTTHGSVRAETLQCWTEMRSHSEKQGLTNVRWYTQPGSLVAKARNDAVRSCLADPGAQWLMQIDADMTFAPDALLRLLTTAYAEMPFADAVGGYCPLRGDLALPTLDTGSGTWESIFPGSGTLEVMRTGAAFILTKRHVYEGLTQPWYALRVPMRPIDAMLEVDNFARTRFDGENPFRNLDSAAWEKLERCAIDDPSCGQGQFTPNECGEDSGACDRMRNAGFRLFVNTDVVTGHVDTKIIDWRQHKTYIEQAEKNQRLGAGLLA
jgi:hypothetical protein